MDLLQIIKERPVLSLGSAALVIGAAIGGFLAVDERYAHAHDVATKADITALQVDADKHAAEDKVRESKQAVRDAWLSAGQAKTDATMARNRKNDCLIKPPKTPLELAACAQYSDDMADGNARYQQAQEAARKASREP